MNNLMTIICLSLCAVSSITAQEDSASDIIVVITNFDNNQGKAYIALYNSEESFLKKGLIHLILCLCLLMKKLS